VSNLEAVRGLVEPVVDALGLRLYDVDLTGSGRTTVLRVLVDQEGGVDLEAISAAAEAVSAALDHAPAASQPSGPYALEVSSPGLERPLRRPEHYRGAVGAEVSVKTREHDGSAVRRRGVVASAGDDGFELTVDGATEHVGYDRVIQARTVFEWGPAPEPRRSRQGRRKKEVARR